MLKEVEKEKKRREINKGNREKVKRKKDTAQKHQRIWNHLNFMHCEAMKWFNDCVLIPQNNVEFVSLSVHLYLYLCVNSRNTQEIEFQGTFSIYYLWRQHQTSIQTKQNKKKTVFARKPACDILYMSIIICVLCSRTEIS